MLDEHRHCGCPEIIPADAVRHNAGHVEQRPVNVLRVDIVAGKRPFGAVALGFCNLSFYWRIIPAVSVFVELLSELLPHQARKRAHPQLGQSPMVWIP